jgi:hypothetical protein
LRSLILQRDVLERLSSVVVLDALGGCLRERSLNEGSLGFRSLILKLGSTELLLCLMSKNFLLGEGVAISVGVLGLEGSALTRLCRREVR